MTLVMTLVIELLRLVMTLVIELLRLVMTLVIELLRLVMTLVIELLRLVMTFECLVLRASTCIAPLQLLRRLHRRGSHAHLMMEAIIGHQRQSEVIKGN
jgi:hypothetical protein